MNVQQQPYGIKEMQRDTKEADKSILSKLYFHYFRGKQFTQKHKSQHFFFNFMPKPHRRTSV